MFYIYHSINRIDLFVAEDITSWDNESVEFKNLKSIGWIDQTSAGFSVINDDAFVFYPPELIDKLYNSLVGFKEFDDRFEAILLNISSKIKPNQYREFISGVMNI